MPSAISVARSVQADDGREPDIAADPELRKLRTLSRVLDGALRRKLPPVVIARMLMNLAVDALVGAVPLVAAGYLAWRLTAWACGQVPTP